jgi:hypothetical protein
MATKEELGDKLFDIVQARNLPNMNTRAILVDKEMWNDIAETIMAAMDKALEAALDAALEAEASEPEPVEEVEVEEVAPKRKTSRRGKK